MAHSRYKERFWDLDYIDCVHMLIKAYEERHEEARFKTYLNYRQTDILRKQMVALVSGKEQEPTLGYEEWKKPMEKQEIKEFTEEEKQNIRKHTNRFLKKGGESDE